MEGTSDNILATLPNCGNPLKLEMETKPCRKCKEIKTLDMFNRTAKGTLTLYCQPCLAQAKEERLEKARQYRHDNKEEYNQRAREKYARNKEKVLQYHQNRKALRNEWKRNKGKSDPVFRAKESMKVRIHDLLKNVKAHKTNKLMGCSKAELQEWLTSQFGNEYSWDTYGNQWHIDHVVPINFFNLQNADEQLICFNWSNLRPLKTDKNVSKSNKLIITDILQHIQILKKFPRYQADYENSWWRRLELRYGNNPQDEEDFEGLLKWAIRSQDSS